MATMQQYSLRWNNYFRHLTYALDNHRTNDDFVDVSLCCDGRKIKAHKVVLSSCSSYFKEIFKENPHPHPVIIFKFIKFEDLNSIIEFMYQGEVNVQQEALQSFLQTAELLAVQGLTAEEKEKPKPPQMPVIDEQKLIKTIPSTIRAITENTTTQSSQTMETPTATIIQQQHMLPQQQHQQQQQQQPHLEPQQIQNMQHQSQQPQTTQVTPVLLQQAPHHTQQQHQMTSISNVPTASSAVLNSNTKKRKITFSDDDDNIYTTETVDYAVKDDASIVKGTEMTFLRGTVKMDIPEYIVSEVDESQQLSDGPSQQNSQDASGAAGQNVTQYTSEYEILTESEIEEKYQQADADNSEITIEMGRLLSTTASVGTTQSSMDDGSAKADNKNNGGTDESLVCGVCKRKLQSASALRRHTASRHTQIKEKQHECIMCSKSFKTKWSLSTHNSRFHRDVRVTKECIKMEFYGI